MRIVIWDGICEVDLLSIQFGPAHERPRECSAGGHAVDFDFSSLMVIGLLLHLATYSVAKLLDLL